MKTGFVLFCTLVLAAASTLAQYPGLQKLKVFIDCSSTWCDMQHIRSEITAVNFTLDNVEAEVHVLVTGQSTGGGGYQYQLIFFGQQRFKGQTDTLTLSIDPNATEFEQRDALLKYLKAGLLPFIVKTGLSKSFDITLKSADTTNADLVTSDPWNYWVLRVGAYGNINEDANYKNISYSSNFSANRITDEIKIGVGINWNKNKSSFEFEDNGAIEKFIVNNHSWSVNQYIVKSINQHWSWAYDLRYNRNTFFNNKGRASFRIAAEYNIFPYKDVNNKLLTLSYGFTARKNRYYDTTIYNKIKQVLFGHRATAYLSLNQKWGNSYAGISYHNYFHDWKFFNLGVDIYTNVRISGGLSFFILAFGGLTRDQVFLVKGNATPEEVLARRRQLASGYNYYTTLGINYRFGSKLNNVVNPRFDRSGNMNED